MIRVDGSVKKHYIPSNGCYKYKLVKRYRYFTKLEDAISYANDVYYKTGVMLGIRDVTRNKSI